MVEVRSEIVANVWQVCVVEGDHVSIGETLVILESMKMEIPVEAPSAGRIIAVHVQPDDPVGEGDVLVVIE